MKDDLEKELFEIGKDFMHPDPELQNNLLFFGCECNDGWFDILKKLIEDIKRSNPPEGFEVFQIKSKFGTLRFYTSGPSTDRINRLIEEAEEKAALTCEFCGAEAEMMRINGWYFTVCGKCKGGLEK